MQDHGATNRDTSRAPETFLSTSMLGNVRKVVLLRQVCSEVCVCQQEFVAEREGLSRLFSMEMYGDGTTAFSSRCVHTGLKLPSLIGMTQAAHIHL